VEASFNAGLGKLGDLECDCTTFADQGVDAIWAKRGTSGDLIAYAVPSGTCLNGDITCLPESESISGSVSESASFSISGSLSESESLSF